MTVLPDDLQRLPSQALDVIRYLGRQEDNGALIYDIMDDMDLSERIARKWVRRLVTRYYAEMPEDEYYVLTAKGQDAAQALRDVDGDNPPVPEEEPVAVSAAVEPEPELTPDFDEPELEEELEADLEAEPETAPEPVPALPSAEPTGVKHQRLLTVVTPKELVVFHGSALRAALDAPTGNQPPLPGRTRVLLRVSGPGCDVRPVEHTLEIAPGGVAGPVQFDIMPSISGQARVKVEVHQLLVSGELIAAGGLYFDVQVNASGTPSPELQALGAQIGLSVSPTS